MSVPKLKYENQNASSRASFQCTVLTVLPFFLSFFFPLFLFSFVTFSIILDVPLFYGCSFVIFKDTPSILSLILYIAYFINIIRMVKCTTFLTRVININVQTFIKKSIWISIILLLFSRSESWWYSWFINRLVDEILYENTSVRITRSSSNFARDIQSRSLIRLTECTCVRTFPRYKSYSGNPLRIPYILSIQR